MINYRERLKNKMLINEPRDFSIIKSEYDADGIMVNAKLIKIIGWLVDKDGEVVAITSLPVTSQRIYFFNSEPILHPDGSVVDGFEQKYINIQAWINHVNRWAS